MNRFLSKRFTLALTLAFVMIGGWMLLPSEAVSQMAYMEGAWVFTDNPVPGALAPWIMAAPRPPDYGYERDSGDNRDFAFARFRDRGDDRDFAVARFRDRGDDHDRDRDFDRDRDRDQDRHRHCHHHRHHDCELSAFK